jgi:hypothetical protein
MYPHPTYGETLPFPLADLPSEVYLDFVLEGLNPLFNIPGTAAYNLTGTGRLDDLTAPFIILLASPPEIPPYVFTTGWLFANAMGPSQSGICLIGLYAQVGPPPAHEQLVYDPFSNTYTVNGVDPISRVDPPDEGQVGGCIWEGYKTGGGLWTLDYGETTPYKWHLFSSGDSPTSDDKTSPQSSPAGAYGSQTVA